MQSITMSRLLSVYAVANNADLLLHGLLPDYGLCAALSMHQAFLYELDNVLSFCVV